METDLISPHYQIYNRVFSELLALGVIDKETDEEDDEWYFKTYDYLPTQDAELPFVYIGEQFNVDTANKSSVTGELQQTLHIYGGVRQRKDIYIIMNEIKSAMRKIKNTDNFYISVRGISDQLLLDNSGSTDLLHGIVEIEFKFN